MNTIARKLVDTKWQYGDQDRTAARELAARLAAVGAERGLVTYSDLVAGVEFHLPSVNDGSPYMIDVHAWGGLDRRIVGEFLGWLSAQSYEQGEFFVSALVVDKGQSSPSWHFFDWMKHLEAIPDLSEGSVLAFWAEQVKKAHNWFARDEQQLVI